VLENAEPKRVMDTVIAAVIELATTNTTTTTAAATTAATSFVRCRITGWRFATSG
jgi:hypothetical protein